MNDIIRHLAIAGLAASVAFVACYGERGADTDFTIDEPGATTGDTAAETSDETVEPSPEVIAGAEHYATLCALCHAEGGEGYISQAANALSNQDFLAVATDAFLVTAVADGRPGTKMSGWAADIGGPLDEAEVDELVAFMRFWQTVESVDVHEDVVTGDAGAAEPVYQEHCAECHGEAGEGALFMSLANPVFLHSASDGFLRHTIAVGRAGTDMPGYEGVLDDVVIDDLVALLRSWQGPLPEARPFVEHAPTPKEEDLVVNYGGPEPDFVEDPTQLYQPIDDVKAALDAGAQMIFIDARPASDYQVDHVAGAWNIPFFEIEDRWDEVPEGYWVFTYCACPHDASGIVAEYLRDEQGYPNVRVLDEGYLVWMDRGYPVEAGEAP